MFGVITIRGFSVGHRDSQGALPSGLGSIDGSHSHGVLGVSVAVEPGHSLLVPKALPERQGKTRKCPVGARLGSRQLAVWEQNTTVHKTQNSGLARTPAATAGLNSTVH